MSRSNISDMGTFQFDVFIVSTQMSNFRSSALLSAADTLDFRSDPFGSLSQLMCGTDFNMTSRAAVRSASTESDQQNTRAATADNTNTSSSNTSKS